MLETDILVLPGPRLPIPLFAAPFDGSERGQRAKSAIRVLVVEDDFLVAGELEHWLAEAGFEVVGPAATAVDAIRLALETKPALVVMDIRLIGARDGIDAAIDIYRQAGIRSIFATAHSDAHTMRRGEAAKPLDWVQKPYNPAALVARIKTLAGKT